MSDLYTLESLSKRMGGIPISTLKHRINQLGIPAAARGSRNKLLFDERAVALLEASDQLMREGHGINTTRRMLNIETPPIVEPEHEDGAPLPAPMHANAGLEQSLQQLADALTAALARLEAKDALINQLQEELRRSAEASATFQQKTFYLQGELQRLQGELKDARNRPPAKDGGAPWNRLFNKKDPSA
jgi:DNA-binding transcriptional MerR regulator